jgi:hypothetical protein
LRLRFFVVGGAVDAGFDAEGSPAFGVSGAGCAGLVCGSWGIGSGFGGCFDSVAGTSALMGCFRAKAGTVQAGRWLAGQLTFRGLVD